jgi:hypothetical protein
VKIKMKEHERNRNRFTAQYSYSLLEYATTYPIRLIANLLNTISRRRNNRRRFINRQLNIPIFTPSNSSSFLSTHASFPINPQTSSPSSSSPPIPSISSRNYTSQIPSPTSTARIARSEDPEDEREEEERADHDTDCFAGDSGVVVVGAGEEVDL